MNELAKWNVQGPPVKTLKSEIATWDRERRDWQTAEHVTVTSFDPDGTLSSTDFHNPDGTIAHSRFLRDGAGRPIEFHSWMNDGPIDRTVYVYDEGGRPIRTTYLGRDGTSVDVEVYSYDSDGKRTKVRFLPRPEANAERSTGLACRATTGYSIDGTDSAYGAPGATTMTTDYDERDFPTKVSFHDATRHLLSYVILLRDGAGRLISEEFHQGGKSPFQNYLDDKTEPEERERLAAVFDMVFKNGFSSTSYEYDARGRLMTRQHRMGTLGGTSTAYRYGERDDPVEETIEHRTREASLNQSDDVQYSSDRINVQHNQLEYDYDSHGNWTERIMSFRPESEPNFQRSNIVRRRITYYPTSG